jgi:hypothetical protein
MAVTPGSLKAKFAELASVTNAELQTWIDEAELNVCRDAWGDRADDGVSYLAAHLAVTFGAAAHSGVAGASGPATSVRVDQLATTYAVGDVFKNSDLGTTKFGRRFLSMRSLIFAARVI